MGTSNTKYINRNYLSHGKINVITSLKYTIKEADDYITRLGDPVKKPLRGVVLHLGGNDLKDKSAEVCVDELNSLVEKLHTKYPDIKISVSLGLPRANKADNQKVEKFNVLIKEKLRNKPYVILCDNGNLFFRGLPARNILNRDGIHLTRKGSYLLTGNLKKSIEDMLPKEVKGNRQNDFRRHQSTRKFERQEYWRPYWY